MKKLAISRNTYNSSTESFAKGIAIKNEKQIKDLGLIFTANMIWNCDLEMAVKKGFQKLNHLRRVIPRTTKQTVKCTVVKKYIFSAVFYASNVWNPGPTKWKMKNDENIIYFSVGKEATTIFHQLISHTEPS